MKNIYLFILLFPLIIFSQNTSEKKAYEPWYTGPLISTGANNIPIDQVYVQPYLYYFEFYNDSAPKTFNFLSQMLFQAPITSWLDTTFVLSGNYAERQHKSSFQFADVSISLGFQLLKEKEFTPTPSIRIKIYENFPTGKYNNLNPNKLGTDVSGTGSFETAISFIIGKTSYWFINHPICWMIDTSYNITCWTNVKNFHRYGGGFSTKGKVKPGNSFTEDIAIEYSFNQRWVLSIEGIYDYTSKTTFKGNPGIDFLGNDAVNFGPSGQQISFAPALEYNFNIDLGIIAGMFFSVWQKNIPKFISGVISVAYGF
jgi:hypothetical protein